MTLSLEVFVAYPHSCRCSECAQDTSSDQPVMDRHHRARGRAHDQSALHTQQPSQIIAIMLT